MVNQIITVLFIVLLIIPFFSLISTIYLTRLTKETISPPTLLILLTIEASVSLISSSYLAVLTINARYFKNPNPAELLPLTLVIIIAPLMMINIIAFTLWRIKQKNGRRLRKRV
jgi:hypothetical protein